jgi:hypothetical protein
MSEEWEHGYHWGACLERPDWVRNPARQHALTIECRQRRESAGVGESQAQSSKAKTPTSVIVLVFILPPDCSHEDGSRQHRKPAYAISDIDSDSMGLEQRLTLRIQALDKQR